MFIVMLARDKDFAADVNVYYLVSSWDACLVLYVRINLILQLSGPYTSPSILSSR